MYKWWEQELNSVGAIKFKLLLFALEDIIQSLVNTDDDVYHLYDYIDEHHGVMHLLELIKNDKLYDNKLLALLMTTEEEFLRALQTSQDLALLYIDPL